MDLMTTLVNVGYAVMLLGFVLRDVLKLRSALIVGQACVVIFNLSKGVIPSAFWNGLFMCINIIWVSRIIYERRPVKIPAEIKDLYEKIFVALTPKEFMDFWKTAATKIWSSEVVVREGEVPSEIFFITGGSADVVRDGRKLTSLERGRFFAEMSFLTGQPASADIRGGGDLQAVAWKQEQLRALKSAKPALYMKLQGIFGCDLAAKIREANEALAARGA